MKTVAAVGQKVVKNIKDNIVDSAFGLRSAHARGIVPATSPSKLEADIPENGCLFIELTYNACGQHSYCSYE